jgi:hypothetical protein
MCRKIKKSRESPTAENHIFYDLAEFAPLKNPFKSHCSAHGHPTCSSRGTRKTWEIAMEKITQADALPCHQLFYYLAPTILFCRYFKGVEPVQRLNARLKALTSE